MYHWQYSVQNMNFCPKSTFSQKLLFLTYKSTQKCYLFNKMNFWTKYELFAHCATVKRQLHHSHGSIFSFPFLWLMESVIWFFCRRRVFCLELSSFLLHPWPFFVTLKRDSFFVMHCAMRLVFFFFVFPFLLVIARKHTRVNGCHDCSNLLQKFTYVTLLSSNLWGGQS